MGKEVSFPQGTHMPVKACTIDEWTNGQTNDMSVTTPKTKIKEDDVMESAWGWKWGEQYWWRRPGKSLKRRYLSWDVNDETAACRDEEKAFPRWQRTGGAEKDGPREQEEDVPRLGGHAPAVVKQQEVDCGAGTWGQSRSGSILERTRRDMIVHSENFLSNNGIHQSTLPNVKRKGGDNDVPFINCINFINLGTEEWDDPRREAASEWLSQGLMPRCLH